MATKSGLKDDEINRYWESYYSTVETQMTAQSKLRQLEDDTEDLGEKSGYRASRLRTEADIELLRAKRIAFMADSAAINPPSDTLVNAIKGLAAQVAAKSATRNEAVAIVGVASSAMTSFSTIQA